MKKILILMGLCIMFAMQNCASDSEPMPTSDNEKNSDISHMVVKFDGKVYETDVKTVGDSVQYLNSVYADVFDTEISKIKDGATLLYTDENGVSYVEYFYSEKELLSGYDFASLEDGSVESDILLTRSGVIDLWPYNGTGRNCLACAILYDDKKWKDTHLITYFNLDWHNSVGKLSELGFNDKTSSIRLYNNMKPTQLYSVRPFDPVLGDINSQELGSNLRPVLMCYHNKDYSGEVLYCVATPAGSTVNHEDENLKTIGWNDRISSIDWTLVIGLSAFQGDNPEIPEHKDC